MWRPYQQFYRPGSGDALNRRVAARLGKEQAVLQPLPDAGFASYTELVVKVTRSATIDVRRVLYTVPSRLVGERLRVHLYQDRLVGYLGTTRVVTLPRIHAHGQTTPAPGGTIVTSIHGLAAKTAGVPLLTAAR